METVTCKTQLKKLRKEYKLSQTEFAKKTGVSRSYIAQIELGNKDPSIAYLNYVITVFNLSISFFSPINFNNKLTEQNCIEFLKQTGKYKILKINYKEI
ncbi:hypothetical protein DRF62_18580 [Chryseobacterium piscium]|uniref:HTH cro/C1-type domain-containing protein n=1 Tax=Chryseobacterium piscium TaxID=333702 RepID=A0A3D9BB22_9FLAO|nr:helix-turn-helix transcriptional regulator [Chryseobacterium piscium]REC50801.1 hypothetical protein DRF62_18580 [Chryseobacterium piscium]